MQGHYTRQQVLAILRQRFPKLSVSELFFAGAGDDCDAFCVNRTLIFKFPRHPLASCALQKEAAILQYCEGRLPVAVPRVLFFSGEENAADYPYCLLGEERMQGRFLSPAIYRQFSAKEQENLAEQIAAFLTALHALPIPQTLCALQNDEQERRKQAEALMQQWLERVPEPERRVFMEQAVGLRKKRETADKTQVLIHGDFSCNHILLDEQRANMRGVIDFADAAAKERAYDFVYLLEDSEEEIGSTFGRKVLAYYKGEQAEKIFAFAQQCQEREAFEQILRCVQMKDEKAFQRCIAALYAQQHIREQKEAWSE